MQIEIEESVEIVRGGDRAGVLVTCEHASERLPSPWSWSERDRRLVGTHWAFDLGAADLAREYAEMVGGVAGTAINPGFEGDHVSLESRGQSAKAIAETEKCGRLERGVAQCRGERHIQ